MVAFVGVQFAVELVVEVEKIVLVVVVVFVLLDRSSV